jgi:hypothetical protein
MDEEGHNEGHVLSPSCDSQSDPRALCLPVTQYDEDTSESGRKMAVMPVMMINAAVAVGRMHQAVATTACTA